MTPAARERMQIRVAVLLISAAAWIFLVLEPGAMTVSTLCPEGMESMASGASFKMLMGAFRPVPLIAYWVVMTLAMMTPLMVAPLSHIYYRSLARRRAMMIQLFAASYAAIWVIAGIILVPVLIASRWLISSSPASAASFVFVALVWQLSPAKQKCLNRSHYHSPLAAFGIQANRDAICFGLSHGAWCVGSCWALMLLPLAFSRFHLLAMAAITLWLVAERLETPVAPRWRWRGPAKALRILCMQTQIRLQRT
ncbi:MAG: DUF2182 domain-containing protein [Candidatus Angelobacter sp.]